MSRRLARSVHTSARALLGFALAVLPAAAHADPVDDTLADAPLAEADPTSDTIPGEQAVFARFSDLGTEATRERLDSLLAGDDTAERLFAITALLSRDGVTARVIERQLLPLIAGLEEEAADDTLAALMLDQYETQVRARLASGELGVPDVFAYLEARAEVVVTAAYGSISASESRDPRARAILAKKRRI